MMKEPTVEELQERVTFIESRYEAILKLTEERNERAIEQLRKGELPEYDPTINCAGCNKSIYLPVTYWNVEEGDVTCDKCGALQSVSFIQGELKKIILKKAGSGSP